MDRLDGDAELQRITGFAADLCQTPLAFVSIVEEARQRFLSTEGTELAETPRSTSFCAHTMLNGQMLEVEDASEDPRFANYAIVTGEEHVRFYAGAPLVSAEGAPLGALCVIDTEPRPGGLTDLQRSGLEVMADAVMRRMSLRRANIAADNEIAEREARLRSIIDSVPGIAWSADPEGRFDYFNARWQQVTGAQPPENAGEWRDFIHPEDFDGSLTKFTAALENLASFEDEWRLKQSDGSYRWVLSRAVPVSEGERKSRWFGTLIDIDVQHKLSDSRELLAGELSHRIKNIFAVVSGLVAIKSRHHDTVDVFAQDLNKTIHALGRAHDYIRPVEGRNGDNLLGLLKDLLAPYQNGSGDRISIAGADIPIGNRAATPLALIFHELATNSAKYGALSCDTGRIEISLTMEGGDPEAAIRWVEFAGPCPSQPESDREGFGSRLLRLAVEGQLAGKFDRSFSDDGLICEIRIPAVALHG